MFCRKHVVCMILFAVYTVSEIKIQGLTLSRAHELSCLASCRWQKVNYHNTIRNFCNTQHRLSLAKATNSTLLCSGRIMTRVPEEK